MKFAELTQVATHNASPSGIEFETFAGEKATYQLQSVWLHAENPDPSQTLTLKLSSRVDKARAWGAETWVRDVAPNAVVDEQVLVSGIGQMRVMGYSSGAGISGVTYQRRSEFDS